MACGRTIQEPCLRLFHYWRRRQAVVGLVLFIVAFAVPRSTMADPIKAGVAASVSGGYARLVFSMSEYDEASVRQAGTVLIISFKQPLAVSVDRLAVQAPDYIGAARRDPDGKAVRLALARKVTVNAMPAAEKFFVDLLPDTWSGAPPSLPQDVVEELARRAREAEKLAARERRMVQQKKDAPVRVHVATQPTFTRYVFEVPDQTSVAADRGKDRLTLTFDAPLRFDLGDVEAALPRAVGAINSELEDASASVRFSFLAKVDVRTFRDEKGYVVDIVGADAKPDENGESSVNAPQGTAPETAAAETTAPETTAPAMAPNDGAQGSVAGPAAMTERPTVAAPATIAVPTPALPTPQPPAAPPAKPVA
ncbi:MAG: tetratricopeptide repeat protein, partial [Xanthobacteraceae bacterium]